MHPIHLEAPHAMPAEECLEALGTHATGLPSASRAERLVQYGRNVLKQQKGRSLWQIFGAQFNDVLIWLLLGAALLSGLLGEWLDASAMISIVLLSTGLGFFQEARAEKAMEALQQMAAPQARILVDGKREEIDASELVPGDIISLEAGDRLPADARLLEAHQLRIEEASLTGESLPIEKHSAPVPPESIVNDQHNMCFMGTSIVHGEGNALVVATGMKTQMGQIATDIQNTDILQTALQQKFGRLAKQIGLAVLVIIAILLVSMLLSKPAQVTFGAHLVKALLFSLSLAVAAVPSSLPAIVTIGLAIGAKALAQKNMIIKRLSAAESLGSVTVICSDKTGTLTQNEMTVTDLYAGSRSYELTGIGYGLTGELQLDEAPCPADQVPTLALRIAALCNNAELQTDEEGNPGIMGDPTEGALLVAARKGLSAEALNGFTRLQEFPFDAERRLMSVIVQDPENEQLSFCKGAPGDVLERCKQFVEDDQLKPLTEEVRTRIQEARAALASKALRVLALAYKPLATETSHTQEMAEDGLVFVGLTGMLDPPREGVPAAIAKAKKAGIRVIMITGDHALTAQAIGHSIGLIDEQQKTEEALLTGQELEQLEDDVLTQRLEHCSVIARALPNHKLRIVTLLQRQGHIVAMTGDGINDAPALKQSDIGVAMGKTGTDVAKESSDVILVDDRFETLLAAIEEGRNIYDKMLKSMRYLLSCNAGEVLAVFLTVILRLPLPLLPLQILLMNLVTDGLPALALGADPADQTIMERPPRHPQENPLSKPTLLMIGMLGLTMAIGTLALFYVYLPSGIEKARTVAFCTLVAFEMFAVFSARRLEAVRFHSLFSNKWLLVAVASSLLLQMLIVYNPFLQKVFHTTALSWADGGLILLVASSGFVAMELTKRMMGSTATKETKEANIG